MAVRPNDFKFAKLSPKARNLLLKILDIPADDLRCDICGKKTTAKDCGIMSQLLEKHRYKEADILCDETLCISSWLCETEGDGDAGSA